MPSAQHKYVNSNRHILDTFKAILFYLFLYTLCKIQENS